jgi:hypothetical protein
MDNFMDLIIERLPEGWKIDVSGPGHDFLETATITSPDGRCGKIDLIRMKRLDPRGVVDLLRGRDDDDHLAMVVAPYLSSEARRRLVEGGLGYVDSTGNIRVSLPEPAMFLDAYGADREPDPERRPYRSLTGAKAGRIVRALCSRKDSWGVREIAAATNTTPGYVSRLLANLDREALVNRSRSGSVESVDWRRLIMYWADSAPLKTRGVIQYRVAPRGLGSVVFLLPKLSQCYAVTGSFAANRFAPVAPARYLMVYVESIDGACGELGLRTADIGCNVLLVEPKDANIFSESKSARNGLRCAPILQVVADLLISIGRGPAEAEALMEWMAANEESWLG